MRINIAQPSSLTTEDAFARECEKRAERLRARCFAAHRFETRAGGTDDGKIKINVLARVPRGESERERVAPALFCVRHDVHRHFFSGLFLYLRKLLDILALHRVAYAASLH